MTTNLRQTLLDNGYCVAPAVLDETLIEYLRDCSTQALGKISIEHRRRNRSQGSLINLSDYPAFADVIGCAALAELFRALKFPDPVFSSGYIISKPPSSPPLFWHQDWWGWDDPMSYTDTVAQVFIMIYLSATRPENGCLRTIPASHRRRHRLHEATAAHGEALSKVDDPHDPLYQAVAEQAAVAVEPGDVVVGDARLLHGAFANRSQQERTLLTLWYHPDFGALPSGMQARIAEIFYRRGVDTDPDADSNMLICDWPPAQRCKIEHLLPAYHGDARPHDWNRQPDLNLLA